MKKKNEVNVPREAKMRDREDFTPGFSTGLMRGRETSTKTNNNKTDQDRAKAQLRCIS
jgi:hypothetical protein